MIAAVLARLEAEIAALAGRIDGAAQFADLMKRNALPQQTPAAFVLPLGLRGGQANAASGAFTQAVTETIGVVLIIRSHDATGARALAGVDTLITAIINALAGWGPGDETGVFQLARGQLVNMSAGTLVYQLDFSINDQVRILS